MVSGKSDEVETGSPRRAILLGALLWADKTSQYPQGLGATYSKSHECSGYEAYQMRVYSILDKSE